MGARRHNSAGFWGPGAGPCWAVMCVREVASSPPPRCFWREVSLAFAEGRAWQSEGAASHPSQGPLQWEPTEG